MNMDIMINNLIEQEKNILIELENIQNKLEVIGSHQHSIVVKTIQDKQYYYEQWHENGKLKCKSLGRVVPGKLAELESEREGRELLLTGKKEKEFLLQQIQSSLAAFRKQRMDTRILLDYYFEVFWKEELVARVQVEKEKVKVSRYTKHPLKQIFASENMTRYQLNQILAMRCFEKERADVNEKLRALGLEEYNPYEIVKKTHGVSYNDYIWFRFPKETLRARDVLVRD